MIKLIKKATVFNFTGGSIYTKFLLILIALFKTGIHRLNERAFLASQLTFTDSKSIIETLKQGVKYVQS